MLSSEEWTFSRIARSISPHEQGLSNHYTMVLCGGRNLRVTKRSANCDLSHQVVQKVEIERVMTCVATSLVLGHVVSSTILNSQLVAFLGFDVELL